jgi:hypothetical protein
MDGAANSETQASRQPDQRTPAKNIFNAPQFAAGFEVETRMSNLKSILGELSEAQNIPDDEDED